MERAIRLVAVAVCLTVLSVALAIGLLGRIAAAQSPGQAESGTVNRQATFTLLESTRISGTTVNTAAPLLLAGGADASDVSTWNSADVFLSATLAQSATLTATVQFSPDASLWADGEYDYVSSNAIAQGKYQRVLTVSGTRVLRVPALGEHMRLQLTTTGVATATAKATYRNN